MNNRLLDCTNLPCPGPVMRVRDFLQDLSSGTPASSAALPLRVMLDNAPAVENVTRFLSSRGYRVFAEKKEKEQIWILSAQPEETSLPPAQQEKTVLPPAADNTSERICLFMPADSIGSAHDIFPAGQNPERSLGQKLMASFLTTLPEMGDSLWRVILVNEGVRMAVADNPCLPYLKTLEKAGVQILVCGTCLEFFCITEKKAVGETTNMLDIVTSMELATKVIRI